MNWTVQIKGFKSYLTLERSLSENSVQAYLRDISKLTAFLEEKAYDLSPKKVQLLHLHEFIKWLNEEQKMSAGSQARIISGVKAFYKYLLMENLINSDPTTLLEGPRLGRKLPDTLTVEDINKLIDAIDLSREGGQREKAILETLYSCGLRVRDRKS